MTLMPASAAKMSVEQIVVPPSSPKLSAGPISLLDICGEPSFSLGCRKKSKEALAHLHLPPLPLPYIRQPLQLPPLKPNLYPSLHDPNSRRHGRLISYDLLEAQPDSEVRRGRDTVGDEGGLERDDRLSGRKGGGDFGVDIERCRCEGMMGGEEP